MFDLGNAPWIEPWYAIARPCTRSRPDSRMAVAVRPGSEPQMLPGGERARRQSASRRGTNAVQSGFACRAMAGVQTPRRAAMRRLRLRAMGSAG